MLPILKGLLYLGTTTALLAPLAAAPPNPAPDPAEIIRRTVDKDQSNWELARHYTCLRRTDVEIRDSKGNVRKTVSAVHEVLVLFGQTHEKLIEKDGKALEGSSLRKEQEKLDKLVAKRQKETEAERRKRLAEFAAERRKEREFALEIPKAYSFQLLGEEVVENRKAWIIKATPRADFKPTAPKAGILKKFEGRIWVDQAEYQMVRVDAKAIDTVSFGWLLARVAKGTTLRVEQARINDEVWMPKSMRVALDARLGLLMHMQGDVNIRFDGFRKFQSESRIVSSSETQPE